MRLKYGDVYWDKVKIKDKECIFSDMRIDRSSVPEGMYQYELADNDSDGEPCRMRPGILVNFFGTILTKEPFNPDEGDSVYLDDGDFVWIGG